MARLHPAGRPFGGRASLRPSAAAVLLIPMVFAARPTGAQDGAPVPVVNALEYEGWRQYSTNCARCHGQDVLGNPVAANLLTFAAPDGPVHDEAAFTNVVNPGRPEKGMPAFGKQLTPAQVKAIYAYVVGRAEKRIGPGRPKKLAG